MKDKYVEELRQIHLSNEERRLLLELSRGALNAGVQGKVLEPLELEKLPDKLTKPGATFVTLTKGKELRGCIGSLEAKRPLAEDVRIHAIAAALEDYRFPPVNEQELDQISIEISRLTTPQLIEASDEKDLLSQIRPGIDGVILIQGIRRATFLPQVWEKIPEVELFLEMLCRKMGSAEDCWKMPGVQVFIYQVEKFHE